MSNWTHVAGIIRIDDFRGIFHKELPNFDKLIGKEMIWNDNTDWENWEKAFDKRNTKYLPMGSEGSLEKSVWINPDVSCTAAYTISIFGDLRDHDNAEDIIKWFKKRIRYIERNYYPIRQAIITVENEWHGTKNWIYEREDD